MIAFGPVPSRRLGRSLGINNIPHKICTYSCVYCQLGRTIERLAKRREFYRPEDLFRDVQSKVEKAYKAGEHIDYLTFVPDGEPTLDVNLGREIEMLKTLGIKIAVITNGSFVSNERVRDDLMKADWVSLKVDSTRKNAWRKINRPLIPLDLVSMLDGMVDLSCHYSGELVTETMLVEGVNDAYERVEEVAGFLAGLRPARAYLSIPIRPPAESWVRSPGEEVVNQAYQILNREIDQVEYLIGYEGNAFAFTGNAEEDLWSITAVHPMREEAVNEFLATAAADWSVVDGLVARGQLTATLYDHRRFYMRKIRGRQVG